MAQSFVRYGATGSQSVFSVPFPYLDKSHVKVTVDGGPPAQRPTFTSGGELNLGYAPVAGAQVVIYRQTPDKALVTFTGGNLSPKDLNVAARQAVYLAQEAADYAGEGITVLPGTGNYWARGRRVTEVGAAVEDTDAPNLGQVKAIVAAGGGGTVIVQPGNPGTVTKESLGLGNVDNTSDANKPVSSAMRTAIQAGDAQVVMRFLDMIGASNGIAPLGADSLIPAQYGRPEWIGGGSTGPAYPYTPEDTAQKGQPNGYAGLDATGKVPSGQLPSAFGAVASTPVVYLTDGEDLSNPPADWSNAMARNLARAVAEKKPFIVPAGQFRLSRKFTVALGASDAPFTVFGYGKRLSSLEWAGSGADSGIVVTTPNSRQCVQFENCAFIQRDKAVGTAITVDFTGQIVDAGGGVRVTNNRVDPRGHIKSCYIGGAGNPFQQGWAMGADIIAPVAFHIYENDFWGTLTDFQTFTSDIAVRIGSEDGQNGHPVECYVERNRFFHWNTCAQFRGMEGAYCNFNQMVGVRGGIHFKDTEGRPQLVAIGNHINHCGVGILVDNCYQATIMANLIYCLGPTNGGRTVTGILIRGTNSGCGQILSNQFENTASQDPNAFMNSIIIEAGEAFTIDFNVYRRSVQAGISGVWLLPNTVNCVVGSGEVFKGAPSFRVYDQGRGNMCPGYGLRMQKSYGQGLSPGSLNIVTFDQLVELTGNPGDSLDDGVFVVPSTGVWVFSMGVVLSTDSTGGVIVNMQLNATQGNPIMSQAGYFPANTVCAFTLTTAPRIYNVGDQIRVGVNSSTSRSVVVNPGTYFEARRLS